MGALRELSTLAAGNVKVLSGKVAVLSSLCPSPASLKQGLTRISSRQLHGILAVAQFLAISEEEQNSNELLSIVLEFLRSVPALTKIALWPASFSSDVAATYFFELLSYTTKIVDAHPGFLKDVSVAASDVIRSISIDADAEEKVANFSVLKAFTSALSRKCPPFHSTDTEQIIMYLLDQWILPFQVINLSYSSLGVSTQSSPAVWKRQYQPHSANGFSSTLEQVPPGQLNEVTPGNSQEFASSEQEDFTPPSPNSTPSATPADLSGEQGLPRSGALHDDEVYYLAQSQELAVLQQQSAAETELLYALDRQEIAFMVLARILENEHAGSPVKNLRVQQLRTTAIKQLRTLPPLLKTCKRDWPIHRVQLKTKVSKIFQVSEAAALLQIDCLLIPEADAKELRNSLQESLPLLLDAADACIGSPWRTLKACESFFGVLTTGVSRIAARHGSQIQRLLPRYRRLVISACVQANPWATSKGPIFLSVVQGSGILLNAGWYSDRTSVESFLLVLAAYVRDRLDQGDKEKQLVTVQLNVISYLADLLEMLNKPEAVELILPLFIESLEEGNASTSSPRRLKLLEAVGRMASLGFAKSYQEAAVLLTRSYLDKLSTVDSQTLPPACTTERVETLPNAFLQVACSLKQAKLRSDYRQRLLGLCSDVGLIAEAKNGRSGADLLGPLLPSVAEICSDFDHMQDVEPSLLKLFRNLWFYIALFGLAPPLQRGKVSFKSESLGGMGTQVSTGSYSLGAVAGPYAWNTQWSAAAELITKGTPPLVANSVKWVEDELELNALYNPGSHRSSSNEKATISQRAALSAALGGRVEVSSMSTISGVKACYLLAVAFLEILRFKRDGGILRSSVLEGRHSSALDCVFKYLETPNLMPAVFQCLAAIVHQAFGAAMSWLAERSTATGSEAEDREEVIAVHARFLIRNISHRNETIREIVDILLGQLKKGFPQVFWNCYCLDDLLGLVSDMSRPTQAVDLSSVMASRSYVHSKVRDWIAHALLLAPCTMQGLLQEQFRKLTTWQKASQTSDLLSLLSEIRMDLTKPDGWSSISGIPAVTAAAVAAAGANPHSTQLGNVEVLSTGIISANVKANFTGEIAGMKRLYGGISGLSLSPSSQSVSPHFSGTLAMNSLTHRVTVKRDKDDIVQSEEVSLNEILSSRFVQLLQQFVLAVEQGQSVDAIAFREVCLRSAALILSELESPSSDLPEGFAPLLRLLCWCPVHIFSPEALETGVFVWAWLLSAAPQLSSQVLGELVDSWLWAVHSRKGLFASGMGNSDPSSKLQPHLIPGEPNLGTNQDPVLGITAHQLWLGFLLDRFEVIRHGGGDQLLLIGRLLQGSFTGKTQFSSHPAATGTFFTLMLFGLKFCASQAQSGSHLEKIGASLLQDSICRAGLSWFSVEPGWYEARTEGTIVAEAASVSCFVNELTVGRRDSTSPCESLGKSTLEAGHCSPLEPVHLVKGKSDNDLVGADQRRQLLLVLSQHEADRLDSWAHPLRESQPPRLRISMERWAEIARTAWSVNPQIALSLLARFPSVATLRAEVTVLVQGHTSELFNIPQALPYVITPKSVEEDSPVLQKLPHWAPCSITQALEFLTTPYKGHPRVMAYVLRVLQLYPPENVTFFMPQLVQALRYDRGGLVEDYLVVAAQRSNLFAHMLIWHLQGEEPPASEDAENYHVIAKGNLYDIAPRVKQRIIDSFSQEAHDVFVREFRFFDKVTSISGLLYPLPKDERRGAIRRELEKIDIEGDDLYLPMAPRKLLRGIELDSGIPLQSAAKVPIMITFDVVDKDGDAQDTKLQACIFKVGDDCRQDVLALQVISLLRDIFTAVGLNLYLFPYGVLPTGYGRGIIEVVPYTRSRNQMGETTDGGLYEIFQQEYGPVGSSRFECARDNFIVSSAGYAVASLLLQPKDRHNGNLLFDSEGRLVHIDFGFILETSPGGNMRFENAQFKLSHEMTQLLDPSGSMKSDAWHRFVSLCVKGYLAARQHMSGILNTVMLMADSGLPCFSRGDPLGNLRKRFHPELSEREAANFMMKTCADAYNKWSTTGYDLIQKLQQGIEM